MLFWMFSLLDPHYRLPVLFILKLIVSLCVNYLLKIMSKIKPKPVGLCYASSVYWWLGNSLYWLTPSFSVVKQFNWPELMLPIKTLCKIKLRPVGLCYLNGVEWRWMPIGNVALPINTKFVQVWTAQLAWINRLPIKSFQFKICELHVAVTDNA